MPTIFIIFGYRFYFWSNEHNPIHVHVEKGDCEAKYHINPLELVENYGFKCNELKMIESIIEENTEVIINHWNTYFRDRNYEQRKYCKNMGYGRCCVD